MEGLDAHSPGGIGKESAEVWFTGKQSKIKLVS